MKTTFELMEQYFNSTQDNYKEKSIVDYTLNGTIIKIQYKRYVEWIKKEGKDESWWDYDNFIDVELLVRLKRPYKKNDTFSATNERLRRHYNR